MASSTCETRAGSIWLSLWLAGKRKPQIGRFRKTDVTIAHAALLAGDTPLLYLPGYSRQDVRAIEACPRELQPLAELQYRGVLWTQKNGRDWTISAFLQSNEDGLGLAVSSDGPTKEGLRRSLAKLADQPLDVLRGEAPIRAPFLDSLLHPDEVRNVLRWLTDPEAFRPGLTDEEWNAFVGLCKNRYDFDPATDGPLTAARLLGQRGGRWDNAWRRFAEAPAQYAAVTEKLRQARPEKLLPMIDHRDSWPQDNEEAEASLREALSEAATLDAESARRRVLDLEDEHGYRRASVWAALGRSPLAQALEPLSVLARRVGEPLVGSTVGELMTAYSSGAWQTDLAVLDALSRVESEDAVAAVRGVVRTIYRPWIEAGSTAFQVASDGDCCDRSRSRPSDRS